MGLSDSERISKVIFGINAVVNISNEALKNFDEYSYHIKTKKLFIKGKTLWRTILAKEGNSLFWIFGSDDSIGFSNTTLFSTALYNKIKYAKSSKNIKTDTKDDSFDLDFYQDRLSIEGFLKEKYKNVYTIYKWCQQIQYAANRYKDKLSKSYIPLMNEISDMMGIIFNIINDTDDFARAWLWYEICKKLYGGEYWYFHEEKFDEITKFLLKRNLHHYLGKSDKEIAILRNILADLEKDNSEKNRLKWTIQLTAYEIHKNKYYHKEIEELCVKYQYNWKFIKKKFRKEEKIKKEDEKSSTKNYKDEKKWDREDLLNIKHDYEK